MIVFTDDTRAYDIIETAQILGMTPNSVRKCLYAGRLHGEKLKGESAKKQKIYISKDEIDRFIKARCGR